MAVQMRPVEVISVCGTGGQIRPLRLRMVLEDRQALRMTVDEVLNVRQIHHVGAEAQIFLCRVTAQERQYVLELKYAIRSHCWSVLRKVCETESLV